MVSGLPDIKRGESQGDLSTTQSGNVSHQQETAITISSPAMSPSAIIDISDDDNDTCHDTPLQRIIKVVNVMSQKALSASVSDIGSTLCMSDRIASSAPLNKSRASIGQDLAATTSSFLSRRYFSRFGSNIGSSKTNHSYGQLMDREHFDLNSKRPRIEMLALKHALLEEIGKINEQLIDTVVSICDKDTVSATDNAAATISEGIIVKCSFVAMITSPNLIIQKASSHEFSVHPLKFLVPKSYPLCSPIFKNLHVESRHGDLSFQAMEKFNRSIRNLPHPFSVTEVARTWGLCARIVVTEYAEKNGGGSFSSKYGKWEDCR